MDPWSLTRNRTLCDLTRGVQLRGWGELQNCMLTT